MWENILNDVINEKKSYGEKVNTGANDTEISLFCDKVKTSFDVEIPEAYIKFLKKVNGLEFNGYIIYGIDEEITQSAPNQAINGFIMYNESFYENELLKKYVFLGQSSISWYVYDFSKRNYFELDIPSADIVDEFDNIDMLLEKLLGEAIA